MFVYKCAMFSSLDLRDILIFICRDKCVFKECVKIDSVYEET